MSGCKITCFLANKQTFRQFSSHGLFGRTNPSRPKPNSVIRTFGILIFRRADVACLFSE